MKALRPAAIALAALLAPIYATADDVMQITYKDGTTAQFVVADIEDMTFETVETATPTPEAVDLGLPSGLKWASCNLGAKHPSEYGNFYSWGEINPKGEFINSTCPWYGVDMSSLEEQGVVNAEGNLTASYDAATAEWGDDWRMPTPDEFRELTANCELEWTTFEGHFGCMVTGANGNSIFLPAAGYRLQYECIETIYEGDYWTTNGYGVAGAYYFFFTRSSAYIDQANRACGMSIRPVMGKASEGTGEDEDPSGENPGGEEPGELEGT